MVLSDAEVSALRLVLFRRGMRPGASLDDLEKAVGEGIDDVLRTLNENLAQLGLELVEVDEADPLLGGERKRVFARSREPLRTQDIKLCGWDRRLLAALAITSCYLANRGGKAKEIELANILKSKRVSARKIERLVEAGYLEREGEMVRLSWRANAEIDQQELKRLFVSSKPPRRKAG
jgi:hypothetical protein